MLLERAWKMTGAFVKPNERGDGHSLDQATLRKKRLWRDSLSSIKQGQGISFLNRDLRSGGVVSFGVLSWQEVSH